MCVCVCVVIERFKEARLDESGEERKGKAEGRKERRVKREDASEDAGRRSTVNSGGFVDLLLEDR